jgi:hypothetical protein
MTENFDNFFDNLLERVFHSSPNFISDKFSLKYIGTGEGNQRYGYGLYFTDNPKVAEHYTNSFKFRGHEKIYNYTVDIDAKEDELLNYDLSFEEQSAYVKDKLKRLVEHIRSYKWKTYGDGTKGQVVDSKGFPDKTITAFDESDLIEFQKATGKNIYEFVQNDHSSAKKASELFWNAGIKGLKYITQLDRNKPKDEKVSYNFVIFDDSIVEIYDYDETENDYYSEKIEEMTDASVLGNDGPYDTSDARTPAILGTISRKGKIKNKRKIKSKKRKIYSEASKPKSTRVINNFWFSYPLETLSNTAQNVISKYVKPGTMPCCEMGCQDASSFLAKQLKENGVEDIEIHHGFYKDDGHTWLEVEGIIVDPTASQFDDFPNIDESEYHVLEITEYDEIDEF